jgi:glycosyltransferase involved in cell wall biosynthesis
LRIVYVIPYYLPARSFGGPVSVCSTMAEEMARRGHEVTVLTTDAASRTERTPLLRERIAGVEVVRSRNLSRRLVRENLFVPRGLAAAVDAGLAGADVLHVHEFFTWLTYRAVERAARRRVPVVLTAHGGLSTAQERGRSGVKRALMRALGDRTLARCRAVHVVTRAEAEACRALGATSEQLRLIPYGVPGPPRAGDAARFRARFALDDRPIVLFVGRLLAGKGVDLVMAVARKLEGPAAPLFVVAGPAENRPDLTPGWHGQNVFLTGLLDRPQVEDAYAAATLFTLPSYAEGLPVTALDALASGVPSVLSRPCNLPEVEEAGAGVLVDPTVESLHEGLGSLLRAPERWPAMRAAALRLASERYALGPMHDSVERLYRELAGAA